MKKSSIIFADILVIISLISVVVLSIFAIPLADWYVDWRNIDTILKTVIPVAFWICAVPTVTALLGLMALLRNLFREKIFESSNSKIMLTICCCCIAVALVTLVGTYWYLPFIFVAVTMIFLCLIVSIVRGCFNAAITLREENDLTI